ncbi:MAG: DUF6506 family protein [Candidatus Methanofastidiosia archaeon]|jgi:hypothetical protein
MTFKALFIAHAPDADYKKHRNVIDTGMYTLYSVVVKTQKEAVHVSKEYWQTESITAVLLCPGFTHSDVAEIFEALEGKVSVNVSRGDGPSSQIATEALKRAGFFG